MHQTTIRFSAEMWARLQEAARDGGVSAAQYVREAVVARLAYAAAQGAEASGFGVQRQRAAQLLPAAGEPRGAAARAASMAVRADVQAVRAQARLARKPAQELRQSWHSVQSAVRAQRRIGAWKPATSSHS
jgi:hypothetical protein